MVHEIIYFSLTFIALSIFLSTATDTILIIIHLVLVFNRSNICFIGLYCMPHNTMDIRALLIYGTIEKSAPKRCEGNFFSEKMLHKLNSFINFNFTAFANVLGWLYAHVANK